jgi:hypothetical protein
VSKKSVNVARDLGTKSGIGAAGVFKNVAVCFQFFYEELETHCFKENEQKLIHFYQNPIENSL